MSVIVDIQADGYKVQVGDLPLSALKELVCSNYNFNNTFVLVDENTKQMCLPTFELLFENETSYSEVQVIKIESGEKNKNLSTIAAIARELTNGSATRGALLINLGGGVLCDAGGFAASIYKRGIDFINVPTTLLSQVDASIGGKVSVDLDELKNQLGVFNNPQAVFVDPRFLETLDAKEIKAGYAEIIKHGLIADADYYETLKEHSVEYSAETALEWSKLIVRSIEIKNSIVLDDPKEAGMRKVLNFGHTIGHAIESYFLNTENPLLHGEAIALGMVCELYLSSSICGFDSRKLDSITDHILSLYKPVRLGQRIYDDLLSFMRHDKKNSDGNINFTLLLDIGDPIIDQNADEILIKEALGFYDDIVDRS